MFFLLGVLALEAALPLGAFAFEVVFFLGVLALEAALHLGAFAFEVVFFLGVFFEAVLRLEGLDNYLNHFPRHKRQQIHWILMKI
jgi:hypothetical protein